MVLAEFLYNEERVKESGRMCIISMERSGGGVAAGKRNQERSYHHRPHSQHSEQAAL